MLGDGHPRVGDALQLVVDLHDGEDHAELIHRQLGSLAGCILEQLHRRPLDRQIHLVDGLVEMDDPGRSFRVGRQDRSRNATFDQGLHGAGPARQVRL